MIHFIGWLAREYWWMLAGLCKLEWWLLHQRLFLMAGFSYDAVRFTVWPQLHRFWWMRSGPVPPEPEEPCS